MILNSKKIEIKPINDGKEFEVKAGGKVFICKEVKVLMDNYVELKEPKEVKK